MSCPNCKLFQSECKTECCYMAPISRDVFNRNFSRQVNPIKETIELDSMTIFPITESGKCTFLNGDGRCNIYEDRPMLCRKFGDESHIAMTCAYQTKSGLDRSKKEKKRIQEQQIKLKQNLLNK